MSSDATRKSVVSQFNVSHAVKRGWWIDLRFLVCNRQYFGAFKHIEIWYNIWYLMWYICIYIYICMHVCAWRRLPYSCIHHHTPNIFIHTCVCVHVFLQRGGVWCNYVAAVMPQENHLMILCSFFFGIVILVPMTFICYYQNSINFAVNGAPWRKSHFWTAHTWYQNPGVTLFENDVHHLQMVLWIFTGKMTGLTFVGSRGTLFSDKLMYHSRALRCDPRWW